jgi:hypothetical protein
MSLNMEAELHPADALSNLDLLNQHPSALLAGAA